VSRLQGTLRGRLVVDQTSLKGFYRFELRLMEAGPGPVRLPLPSVAELLPVQLRMTLEDTRALVAIAVVDAISMPTPD
jgi:uncharacterized protein (TIGR03435 family)